jgi:squalene-hopene/tetraprenyl-beta-curcumene cyclase
MKYVTSAILTLFMCLTSYAETGIDNSLLKEANASVDKAVKYLLSKQNDNGSWGPYGGLPAVTAISVNALLGSPEANSEATKSAVAKAEAFLLKFVNADGSIWEQGEKGYPNYTTSLSVVSLYLIDKQKHKDTILKARQWLKKSQFDKDSGEKEIEEGGIGYGSTKSKSDLSNSQLALEALYITHDIENENVSPEEAKATKECWKKAQIFLNRCQALKTTNDQAWAKEAPGEDFGGFIYSPDRTKVKDENGKEETLRVYGSMTYAGLKSMIYAGVIEDDKLIKEDPRIVAAMTWASKNYTLDENPGVGKQGHFYYIHTFTKALDAYGEDSIKTADGKVQYWRKDVVSKLLEMQSADGSWVNENGRWMENVPEMVTAYSLTSMNYALAKDQK